MEIHEEEEVNAFDDRDEDDDDGDGDDGGWDSDSGGVIEWPVKYSEVLG